MMQERLSEWQKHNRDLPDRIVYFRDGVGENQYAMVQQHELNEIRAACRLAKAGYNPPITVVVCTKRHMTRFYPSDETPRKFLDKREENFNPGLVVDDQSIRLPKLFDFWLQAQKPLQGTGRPCHYFVLENEIGYIPTQVQEIVSDPVKMPSPNVTLTMPNRLIPSAGSTPPLSRPSLSPLQPTTLTSCASVAAATSASFWSAGTLGALRRSTTSPTSCQAIGTWTMPQMSRPVIRSPRFFPTAATTCGSTRITPILATTLSRIPCSTFESLRRNWDGLGIMYK